MNESDSAALLAGLDAERRTLGEPSGDGRVVREVSADGAECRIVVTDCPPRELEALVAAERARADRDGYTLEWKTYGHDAAAGLPALLPAAGFAEDDTEKVMVLALSPAVLAGFGGGHDTRRVTDAAGLEDYAEVSRQIGRRNAAEERDRLAAELAACPGGLSVHVAYVDGEPVACGRLYLKEGSPYAELAGGRTKTTHRRRGLFTALVAARLAEAGERGRGHVFVDALPTSEPILAGRGFEVLTTTTPYVYEPRG